jgi:tellurite resistance protein
VCLSFKDDILVWLEACARENTPETPVPVRENLKQLTAAVKSLCGKSEDAEMEDAIFKQITKDDDSVRAALAISGAVGLLDPKIKEAFKGQITERLTKAWTNGGAEYLEEEGRWYYTWLPIKIGNYWLEINYLWDKVGVQVASDAGGVSPEEKNALYEKMSGLFGLRPKPADGYVWYSEGVSWPSFAKDELYHFHLCKRYTERPQEVADKIIGIARELESVAV